jgi:SnoaL-like domain
MTMDPIALRGLAAWHAVVDAPSESALDALLAEDVVFHSPIVHSPQRGRALSKLYLMAAFQVLAGGGAGGGVSAAPDRKFRYVREIVGDRDAVLEFTTEIDGITVNGVDMIRWNDDGRIVDFKVMLRPLKAIQTVHAQMGRMLEAMKPPART